MLIHGNQALPVEGFVLPFETRVDVSGVMLLQHWRKGE
jgi:hypothetical protein